MFPLLQLWVLPSTKRQMSNLWRRTLGNETSSEKSWIKMPFAFFSLVFPKCLHFCKRIISLILPIQRRFWTTCWWNWGLSHGWLFKIYEKNDLSLFCVIRRGGGDSSASFVFLAEFKVWKQKSSQYLNIFHLESSLQDFCFSIYMLKWHGDTRFEERILCLSLSIGFNPSTGNLTVLSESCYQMQYSFLKRI